jgi:hypothetical protein
VSKTGWLYPDSQNLEGCIQSVKNWMAVSRSQNLDGFIQSLNAWRAVSRVSKICRAASRVSKTCYISRASKAGGLFTESQKSRASKLEDCKQSHKKFDQQLAYSQTNLKLAEMVRKIKFNIYILHCTINTGSQFISILKIPPRCHYFLEATPCTLLAFFVHA